MRDELQEAGEICCACFRVFGLLGVKISSFGLKAQGSGSRAHGLGFWAWGSGLGVQGTKVPSKSLAACLHLQLRKLGRPLGHFTFSLIGLKRILFTHIFQRLYKRHLVNLNPQILGF